MCVWQSIFLGLPDANEDDDEEAAALLVVLDDEDCKHTPPFVEELVTLEIPAAVDTVARDPPASQQP